MYAIVSINFRDITDCKLINLIYFTDFIDCDLDVTQKFATNEIC